jgi:hypothetical protein
VAETRTAKLFTHGRSQAVRLPKEFRTLDVEPLSFDLADAEHAVPSARSSSAPARRSVITTC